MFCRTQQDFANDNNVLNGKDRLQNHSEQSTIGGKKEFVGIVFRRMYLISIFGLDFFLSAFVMLHPYLYLYLICFNFECIMANVQMFLC